MFKVGELIIYGNEGVCKVEAVGSENVPYAQVGRVYYSLTPLYREGKTHVPVDTTIRMRAVVSREQAKKIMKAIPSVEEEACREKNLRMLSERYEAWLNSFDCMDLVRLIKSVSQKRETVLQEGKKLGQIDERYLKLAEERLYGELAVALELPREEVKSHVERYVEGLQEAKRGKAS